MLMSKNFNMTCGNACAISFMKSGIIVIALAGILWLVLRFLTLLLAANKHMLSTVTDTCCAM